MQKKHTLWQLYAISIICSLLASIINSLVGTLILKTFHFNDTISAIVGGSIFCIIGLPILWTNKNIIFTYIIALPIVYGVNYINHQQGSIWWTWHEVLGISPIITLVLFVLFETLFVIILSIKLQNLFLKKYEQR
jgi:hypothetical protein